MQLVWLKNSLRKNAFCPLCLLSRPPPALKVAHPSRFYSMEFSFCNACPTWKCERLQDNPYNNSETMMAFICSHCVLLETSRVWRRHGFQSIWVGLSSNLPMHIFRPLDDCTPGARTPGLHSKMRSGSGIELLSHFLQECKSIGSAASKVALL